MTSPVNVVFASNQVRWTTLGLFNTNEFPSQFSSAVDACGVKLALTAFYASLVIRQEQEDIDRFLTALSSSGLGFAGTLEGAIHPEYVAYYHSIELAGVFSSTLYYVKAFLDTFSQVVSRLVEPSLPSQRFNKGKLGAEEIAGGKFINWLRGRSETKHPYAGPLAELFEANSRQWITEAVKFRDQMTHHHLPSGITEMNTPLAKANPAYSRESIRPAMRQSGDTLGQYCGDCQSRLQSMVGEVLNLLPKNRAPVGPVDGT